MVNELGPTVVFTQILPKAVSEVAETVGVAAPVGVTDVQVVPTLSSSNSINGVPVVLFCLKKYLAALRRSVPATAVASEAGSLDPIAVVFSQTLQISFAVPATISYAVTIKQGVAGNA